MVEFEKSVNDGEKYAGKYIELGSNIILSNPSEEVVSSWSKTNAPDGNWNGLNGFAGYFDGKDYCITGLCCVLDTDYAGFITITDPSSQASVKNLVLDKAYIKSKTYAGAIIGWGRNIHIENITIKSGVVCGDMAGGIAGYLRGTGTQKADIIGSKNAGVSVYGGASSGGIVGRIAKNTDWGNDSYNIIIKQTQNYGEVVGSANSGGIIGEYVNERQDTGKVTMTELFNEGKVTGNRSGGIVGGIYSVPDGGRPQISKSRNTGDVYGSECAGGILGRTEMAWWGGGKDIIDCYNLGTISGKIAGGILGSSLKNDSMIRCVNIGDIKGTSYSGAILGKGWDQKELAAIEVNITNCYYQVSKCNKLYNAGTANAFCAG